MVEYVRAGLHGFCMPHPILLVLYNPKLGSGDQESALLGYYVGRVYFCVGHGLPGGGDVTKTS